MSEGVRKGVRERKSEWKERNSERREKEEEIRERKQNSRMKCNKEVTGNSGFTEQN